MKRIENGRSECLGWAAGVLTACGLLLGGGCAQNPTAAASAPQPQPTPPVASSLANTPQTVEAQRRAVLQLYMQQLLADDGFYERTLGVPRSASNFSAIKAGLTSIYTDPIVLDWMMDQTTQGGSREQLVASIAQRSVSGFSRLDDAGALTLLNSIGSMMGRMDRLQCDRYLAPSSDRKSSFTNMTTAMTSDEVRGLFEAFRLSMRADIGQQPLRAVPSRQSLARVNVVLERAQLVEPSARPADNTCRRTARLMQAVATLPDQDRSDGITFVLSVMGMGAQASLNAAPKAPRPAQRDEATARPVNAI